MIANIALDDATDSASRRESPPDRIFGNDRGAGTALAVLLQKCIFYIGSVTYSSAASEPAFDFDTPLSCWLARTVVSDIANWATSGTDEAVSLIFEDCESPPSDVRRATTAESPMTSDGLVSGPTPSRLAAIALRRFTKRVDETIARSAIRMMIAPLAIDSVV